MQFIIRSSAIALALAAIAPAHAAKTVWSIFEHDADWSSMQVDGDRDAVTGESHFQPKGELEHGELARAECVETSDGIGRWTIERKHGPRIETKSLGTAPCDVAPSWAPVTPR